MQNPWQQLPAKPPYVLPVDRPHVNAFNRYAKLNPKHRFDLSLVPQPFLGSTRAPLVVLGRNPDLRGGHRDGPYADAIRENLLSDGRNGSLLGLTARFSGNQNAKWWNRSFKAVMDHLGCAPADIAPRNLSVEFCGYHSERWKLMPTIPSQFYGFWLVERAIDRGATIVMMRGERDWTVAVPTLAKYARLVTLKNAQSNSISPTNCDDNGFTHVLNALS